MNKATILYDNIINNIPFCFIKLNDGECDAIDNTEASLSRGYEKSSSLMSQKLLESLNYQAYNYFIGIPCSKCQNRTYNISQKYLNTKNYENILNANILINSNVDKTIDILSTYLKERNIIIITNEKMNNNIKNLEKINIFVKKVIIVAEKYAFKQDYEKIKDEWKNIENNSVIICLCGPLGRVICYEWFKNNNTLTCLELGSLFDPLLNNKSYLYHTGNHQFCDECFPSNDNNDCNLMKFKMNDIKKECYYFDNLENSIGFYNYNMNKVIKNYEVRLENEPHNINIKQILLNLHENKYKNNNKSQLFNICSNLYNSKNHKELATASNLYLEYFQELNDKDVKKIRFYNGFANFNLNKNQAIHQFEILYNDVEVDDNEKFYVKCNLDLLYPKNNVPIPKIVHLIYFKERDLELYHYACIMSMINNMSEYKFIIYNDIEPINNTYWDLLKNNSKIEIKKYERPTEFDGFKLGYVQYAADVARLSILYEYGGIYMDLDMYIFKNFDNLIHKNDLYISYEGKDNGSLINSILICKPKNEFIKIWLNSFKTGLRMEKWAYHIGKSNKIILDKNKHFLIKYKIELLPSKYFFNFSWTENNKYNNINENINDDMYGLHLFDTILHNNLKNNIFFDKYKLNNCFADKDITSYLNRIGFNWFEGYSQQVKQQVKDLIELTNKPNLQVMEIGFNAGHSAEVFLKNNNTLILTSFDLGGHEYVKKAKEYIDNTFPDRHRLILGDSTETIPRFINENKNKNIKFDVIFIDGGHSYDIALADFENCFHLAHKDTLIIVDDTIFTQDLVQIWTIGPTKVWNEKLNQKKLIELDHKDYELGRGMAWGKYIM